MMCAKSHVRVDRITASTEPVNFVYVAFFSLFVKRPFWGAWLAMYLSHGHNGNLHVPRAALDHDVCKVSCAGRENYGI